MGTIALPKSPPASTPAVLASMRGNRSEATKPENAMAGWLGVHGLTGYVTNCKDLPGSPDFAFLETRVAVLVHGCFWHRCPHCHPHMPVSNEAYWAAKFERNRARDRRVKSALRLMGWSPGVVWECKLKRRPAAQLRRVRKAVGS